MRIAIAVFGAFVISLSAVEPLPNTLPGLWMEAEAGNGHRRTQNWGQASGGQIVGWIAPTTTTTLTANVSTDLAQARLYVRYNLEGGDGAFRLLWGRTDGDAHEVIVATTNTGSWAQFAWTSVALGPVAAGAYQFTLSGAPPRCGGVDVVVLLEDRWHGRYLPPDRFTAGKPAPDDRGRILPAWHLDDAAAGADAVFAAGMPIQWRVSVTNRSAQPIDDRLAWTITDAQARTVRQGAQAVSLAAQATSAHDLVLAPRLPAGWYRVDFSSADGVIQQRWFASARAPAAPSARATDIRLPWLGMNMGHYQADEVADVLSDITDVGLRSVRTGGNAPDPRLYDPTVDAALVAGLDVYWVINYRGHGIDPAGTGLADLAALDIDGPVMQEWYDRYHARCRAIMRHFSSPGAERLRYYLVGNEPALKDAHTGLPGRPDIAVRLTQAMWDAARAVNPAGIVVQSPTGHAPDTDYMRAMIVEHGVHRYCDVIGTHVYGGQTLDPRLAKPWEYLAEAGVSMPVACTESGVTQGWAHKANTPGREWQADYLALHYAKLKRMGYSAGILFTHDCDHHVDWALLRAKGEIISETHGYIQSILSQPRAFRNGSFEDPNDPRAVWVPNRNIDVRGWMEEQFTWQASDQVHSGVHALRLNLATWKWAIEAIQIVDVGVTPGKPVTVRGWVRTSGHAPAHLSVGGYDRLRGRDTIRREVTATEWTEVAITVTPSNPWIAILIGSQSADGVTGAHAWFDTITVDTTSH